MAKFEARVLKIGRHGGIDTRRSYLFVVPGPDSPSPDDWPWLQRLKTLSNDRTEIVVLDSGMALQSIQSWEDILRAGHRLLQCYWDFKSQRDAADDAVAFIAHSLGGLMLKQALVAASPKHTPDQEYDVWNALRFLVFLSCPHPTHLDETPWDCMAKIIASKCREVPESLVSRASVSCLATMCDEFEFSSLSVPIINIFETDATKLKARKSITFDRNTIATVIVSKGFAHTHVDCEELLPVAANHWETCKLKNAKAAREKLFTLVKNGFDRDEAALAMSRTSLLDGASDPLANEGGNPEYDFPLPAKMTTEGTAIEKYEQRFQYLHRANQLTNGEVHSRYIQQVEALVASPSASTSLNLFDSFPHSSSPTAGSDSVAVPRLPCVVHEPRVELNDFSGRQDILNRMFDGLLPTPAGQRLQNQEIKVFVLCACAGMGKTSLAAEFFSSAASQQLYDAQFWISADRRMHLANQFSNIARELGLADGEDKASARRALVSWLQNPVKQSRPEIGGQPELASWLMILDNVTNLAWIKDYWPRSGVGSIILTTRNPSIQNLSSLRGDIKHVSESNFHHLSGLSTEESLAFLKALAPNAQRGPEDEESALLTVKLLSGIPLALRLVASLVSNSNMRFTEFIQSYEDEEHLKAIFDQGNNTVSPNCDSSLATVWIEANLSPLGQRLLHVLSLFSPERIPERLLKAAKHAGVSDFDIGPYSEARGELWRNSLIRMHSDGDYLQMYGLVQADVRMKMTWKDRQTAFETGSQLLLAAWPKEKQIWNFATRIWKDCEMIVPHVQSLFNYYKSQKDRPRPLKCCDAFLKLLLRSGWYDHDSGSSQEAKPKFELAEDLCRQAGKTSESTLIEIHSSRGAVASETNDVAGCHKHYSEMYRLTESRRLELSDMDRDINDAIAKNELGVALMMKADIVNALQLFEAARCLTTNHMYKSERPEAGRFFRLSSANLGLAYWLSDRNDDAIEVLKTGLRHCNHHEGAKNDDSFILGRFYHALGNVYESKQKYEKAYEWHIKAHLHYSRFIGDDHHRTADVATRVAQHMMRRGKYTAAREYLENAIKVFTAKPCFKPELVRAKYMLASVMEAMGQEDQSRCLQVESNALFRELKKERSESWKSETLTRSDCDQVVTFWSR